jgi:hypothetical protein
MVKRTTRLSCANQTASPPLVFKSSGSDDRQEIVGAGYSVEITSDPIVIDIRQKFAWLRPLEDKAALSNIIYLPNKLSISRYLFIGDAS